jgi:hypothetical protein
MRTTGRRSRLHGWRGSPGARAVSVEVREPATLHEQPCARPSPDPPRSPSAADRALARLVIGLALIVIVLNVLGYAAHFFRTVSIYDEAVHALTTATVCLAAALWRPLGLRGIAKLTSILALCGTGLLIGLTWEFFEWLAGLIGDRTDTLVDLLMDGVGAAGAAIALQTWHEPWLRRRGYDGA